MTGPSANDDATVEGTIAFTDIVGFTELVAAEGDEVALAIVTRQEQIVSAALPDDARIVKELGDGLLLYFPDCTEALSTCLRLQDTFDAESEQAMLPLWVRMGLHWGRAARYRDDLIGHDVNVASRIAGLAGPGEILLSESALARLDTPDAAARCEEIGPVVMKGLPDPVRLFRVIREPARV